jgi:CMP-N-acetylneuraminic acid synthetase
VKEKNLIQTADIIDSLNKEQSFEIQFNIIGVGPQEEELRKFNCVNLLGFKNQSEFKNIAIKNGAEVPFLRPKKLTKEKITTWEVSKDIIENLKIKENKIYNSFIYLQPTSPLRTDIDINKAIRIFKNKKANAVVSVTESKPNFWFKGITKNGAIINNKLNKMKNYILNGAIYIFKTSYIYKSNSNSYDKKTFAYIMPNERSIDIDTELDFKTAELIYKKK